MANEFFVALNGNDAWSGTRREPNGTEDGPFATLDRARDAVRALKAAGDLPAGGVTVWLRGGDYVRETSFALSEQDSGTPEAPVVYCACEGETVRLLGGRRVDGFERVTDPAVLERLHPRAREHVVQLELKRCGVTEIGRLQSRGFARHAPAHLEVFFDGRPLTLARWPSDAATTIDHVPPETSTEDQHGGRMGALAAGFHYAGDRPKRWRHYRDVWVHGYWAWDWANSYEEIESLDTATRLIRTKPPHGHYGFRAGQRFFFLNVLEELSVPGEYYVDVETGILYLWPPASVAEHEVRVSELAPPLVKFDDASHVTLRGLGLECTRGDAVVIKGGTGNRIVGCRIRNIGNSGVSVGGGAEHAVEDCEVCDVGDRGIAMSGGNRKTLEPCGHVAHNNDVYRFSRWSRTYTPGIAMNGVGLRATHNHVHDAPHAAITYQGNEILIEFNDIHDVCHETGDCGAIYTGRDFTARGNVVRHNYIHDFRGFSVRPGCESNGVYFDDCVSGQTIVGNVFKNTPRAAFIGGGRDIVVENNIFIDCDPAVHVDGRGLSDRPVWHNMIYQFMKERLEAMNYSQPPYSERYPELKELDAYYAKDEGIPPEGNVLERNICVGGSWTSIVWHAEEKHLTVRDNWVGEDPGFVDAQNGDYRLREDSPALALGFEPIPFDQIGLLEGEPLGS